MIEQLTYRLDQFEGPLDLLVHLIKITKIDIRDIFISDIIIGIFLFSWLFKIKKAHFLSLFAVFIIF